MFLAYTPAHYTFPLPEGHRYPLYKYQGVVERLERSCVQKGLLELKPSPALSWEVAEHTHSPHHLRRWRLGELEKSEIREYGLPWSVEVVERARLAAGGTCAALEQALTLGWGMQLAGGTHHAFQDRAEGFCLLNDVALCARLALEGGTAKRVFILDLDVHQGNGTARLLANDPRAFTLSVHGARNYPFRKETSSLDLPLEDGTGDSRYLEVMEAEVFRALEGFKPDLLIYLAGVDVLAGDRFGRFTLSLEGLAARDRWVFEWCKQTSTPILSVMSGGYNRDHNLTVQGHAQTVEVGLDVLCRG